MFKTFFTVSLLIVFMFGLTVVAGNNYQKTIVHEKMPKVVEPISTKPINSTSSHRVGDKVGTAVLVATMWNAYSTQSPNTNLIYFDPYSEALAIVHRGNDVQAVGSGYAFYTASYDGGASWTDGIGPFNFGGIDNVRHPNLVISNPTQGADPFTAANVVMFWNTLTPDNWQTVQTATDPFFAASPTNTASWENIANGHFSSEMGVVDQNGTVYAPVATNGTIAEMYLFRTTDLGASWDSTIVGPQAWFNPASAGFNGVFGVSFTPDGTTGVYAWNKQAVGSSDYNMGFVKTTDSGNTWDAAPTWITASDVINFPPEISGVNYSCDMIVDGNGVAHFVGTWIDTVDGTNTGIYDIFWNGSAFESKLISLVNTTTWALPGGLQTLNEPELARNLDGTRLYFKYIDLADTTETLADIFISYRDLTGEWSSPVNITETPLIHEKYTQLASRSVNDKMHIYYTIFGDGDTNDQTESEIWYIQDVNSTGIDDEISDKIVTEFILSQNYPNPFNPITEIRYTVGKAAHVSLDIYNVVGEKVSTLINETMNAGEYKAVFDGTDFASGIYFYKLTADNVVETRKMVLMK